MVLLHWLSILLELGVALLAIQLIRQRRPYGWGILLTFGIYVVYDLARLLGWPVSSDWLYLMFFVASASAFWFVWTLTKLKKV